MGRGVKELQPGSLYITISAPLSASTHCLPRLPRALDLNAYETACAEGYEREEFDWGLYWHRNLRDGTWYTLRREPLALSSGHGHVHPHQQEHAHFHVLERHEMQASPRLQRGVVGLVRVVRIGSGHNSDYITSELTAYLDWLTPQAARGATRSFVWATSCYLRTRRHIAAEHSTLDCSQPQPQPAPSKSDNRGHNEADEAFAATDFLAEALGFAYSQIWSAMAGQLPRPVLASDFGVELVDPGVEEEGELGRRAARELALRGIPWGDARKIHKRTGGSEARQ